MFENLKIYQFDPDLLDCEHPDHRSNRIANEAIQYYKLGYIVGFSEKWTPTVHTDLMF